MRRMRRSTKNRIISLSVWTFVVICSLLFVFLFSPSSDDMNHVIPLAYAQDTGNTTSTPPPNPLDDLDLDPSKFEWDEKGRAFQRLKNGNIAYLTLRKDMQDALQKQMDEKSVPYGGVVAIEPSTGKVLSLVSASHAKPAVRDYAIRAKAPAASVFKIITAAALLEKNEIDVNARICYSGGSSFLTESDVRGNAANDRTCSTLAEAIGHSINAVMARLAYQHLSKQDLEEISLKFGFNREIPFELHADISETDFVDDDIERARSAAGFWHTSLSPLHGAMISAAIANDGVMMQPTLVEEIVDKQGRRIYEFKAKIWLVSMTPSKARLLSQLAETTAISGSARSVFANNKNFPKNIRVAGKTGTLSNKKPFYLFTWFVGWASVEKPEIAVGAVVVNTEKWWIKGTHVVAKAMTIFFSSPRQ